MSQHRHRTGKSAGCCFIFTHTSTPITFSYITSYQIFSRSLIDSNFFRTVRTHSIIVRLIGYSLRSRRFFFHFSYSIKNYRDNSSFLPSPFPTIFLFSLVYSLPLTPTLTRHLRNFTHYHWNDNGRGRKRISLVGG